MWRTKLAPTALLAFLVVAVWLFSGGTEVARGFQVKSPQASQLDGFTGSASCRECHEKFYKLWAPSKHGLAMQPYTAELAQTQLAPQAAEITIGNHHYRADIERGAGWITEIGRDGKKNYSIEHVLGGKNVYYFLTAMEKGRLQTLPIAYDVRKKEWFDTAASGLRHFPDQPEQVVNWKEREYTFNTSCYGCHVSQLSTNYNPQTDTYHTVWREPGINCEACHGPGNEHVRAFKDAPQGTTPKDFKIIRTKLFDHEQKNAMCAPCHAKMFPITAVFQPGDRYFDHYDLVTLESPDFYPDGRDLGENYTYTLWRMSPCVKSGQLDCIHCHTSSGRYRFADKEKANNACMPCHEKNVKNTAAHSHHEPDSEGSTCISCHMPKTTFARMVRSDHSMRPPMPATTIAFKSPNACNLCHNDKDAVWADKWVRKWRKRDYQAQALEQAGLIDAARKRDWTKLPDMLTYLGGPNRDEIYATSLVRLLRACPDDSKWPAIIKSMKDASPLVRSAAAETLDGYCTRESVGALLDGTRDEYRLVRVRSAASLASLSPELLDDQQRTDLDRAVGEFQMSMNARPDDSSSHHNMGNFYMDRGELEQAVAEYKTSSDLDPRSVPPVVNAAIAYARLGNTEKAEQSLVRALQLDPDNAEAHFNLGLLKAQQNDRTKAESHLRAALKADPSLAEAAYNLGILLAGDDIEQAVKMIRKASELRPNDPKYEYTLAFYLRQTGNEEEAIRVLREVIRRQQAYAEAYVLLGDIYEGQGKSKEAEALYRKALANENLPERSRYFFNMKLQEVLGHD